MDEHRLQTSDLADRRADEDEPLERDRPRLDPGRESTAGEWEDAAATGDGEGGASSTAEPNAALLPADETHRLTERWSAIQVGFVDRPRESVEEADTLVAELMRQVAASFSAEREQLERQWSRGDEVSTEDLRVALTRYRSFFSRLLSA